MRRLHMVWIILVLAFLGCRPKTPAVPPPLAWEVQATQTAQVRPTSTPYHQQYAAAQAAAHAAVTTNARSADVVRTSAAHYQINTIRRADGQPVALILRTLEPLNLRELIGNSTLTPILDYYHPNTQDLTQLVVRCNSLPAETLETGQVVLIPLTRAEREVCPPDPTLSQRYLPVETQASVDIPADERVLVYFTQAGETLSSLARKFEITVERLRELNGNLDAAPADLPLKADTLVYLRLPVQYHYTPPVVAVSTPAVPRALVFTVASEQPAPAQLATAPQAAEAHPTPTPEPVQQNTPPPNTPTPEPTPADVVEANPTSVAAVDQTNQTYTATMIIAANPPADKQPPEANSSSPPPDTNPPAEEQKPPEANEIEQILGQYARFLNGEPFSSQGALTTPPLTDGETITLDGDAALKYLSKKNFLLGSAIRAAVRLALHGNILELPAVGFYNIPAGMQLDFETIARLAESEDVWLLNQQQFRNKKDDKLIQNIVSAYDQLLQDRPNLQFLLMVKEYENGTGRMIIYLYDAASQEAWTTLSGAPLNLDGCPQNVQLIMLAVKYNWKQMTAEFETPQLSQ